jgi:hypothetical protein
MAHGLDDQIIDVQFPARFVILLFPSDFCGPASFYRVFNLKVDLF